MRSSSIKTAVVISSVVFTLTLAAPRVEARSSQPRRTTQTQTTLQRAVGQVLRFFGIISEELPSDPIPKNKTVDPATQPFSPTTDVTTIQ
jgi:hypothetical protein